MVLNARLMRPCGFRAQIPEHAADDDQSAERHEYVESFAIKHPSDDRDQRNAHEVQRHHQRGIAGPEGIAEAVM